jgi:hypothetical protein
MHGFLDLGSEQGPSTRGCRCTALVLRSHLEGPRSDGPFCMNLLIGAESTNVKIMSAVDKIDAWSRHPAVWIAECMQAGRRCSLHIICRDRDTVPPCWIDTA